MDTLSSGMIWITYSDGFKESGYSFKGLYTSSIEGTPMLTVVGKDPKNKVIFNLNNVRRIVVKFDET